MNKIHKILWPTYLYVFFLLLFYSNPRDNIPQPLLLLLFFGTPFALWVSIISLVQKHLKKAKRWHYFALCSVPGFILGLQMSYGFYAMGHGDDPVGAILPFALLATLGGAFSGFMGSMTKEASK